MRTLSEDQYARLRSLLREAIQGNDGRVRRFALLDACKIMDVILDSEFVEVSFMKPLNPHRCTNEELKDALPPLGSPTWNDPNLPPVDPNAAKTSRR